MTEAAVIRTDRRHRTEDEGMLLVECPLCATPAAYDTDADELDCPTCQVRLVLAAGDVPADLPLAA